VRQRWRWRDARGGNGRTDVNTRDTRAASRRLCRCQDPAKL
jgi:hypothetical protein